MAVGQGGYGSKNANGHLKWIAEKEFELIDSGLYNLGSTWYGQAEVMVATARYQNWNKSMKENINYKNPKERRMENLKLNQGCEFGS